MEYVIEPMKICLSCYLTGFLRSEEGVRMTRLIFGICNVYIHKILNSFYMGCIWELLEN